MKEIPLTQGKFTLVDDEDYECLMQWKWYANRGKKTFYAVRDEFENPRRIKIQMHIVIATRIGLEITNQIDHKDRNGLNNLRNNLRLATCSQQGGNHGLNKNNTSGYRGVSMDNRRKKWRCRINFLIGRNTI